MPLPIDPSFSVTGPEFRIDGIQDVTETPTTEGAGFGDMLSKSLSSLATSQQEASDAATALATGQASDPTAVVMAVERAQLAMQLASQIRTKAVEAAQDIFHTQV